MLVWALCQWVFLHHGAVAQQCKNERVGSCSINYKDLPHSGFVQASIHHPTTTTAPTVSSVFRIISRKHSDRSPLCTHITIENQPVPNDSPLMGQNLFTLLPELHNDHFIWSNGPEILSFIPHELSSGKNRNAATGNWILGNTPGVDSGYVYHSVAANNLSPVSEPNQDHWHWLLGQSWKAQPDMSVICTVNPEENLSFIDQAMISDHFEVEFFHIDHVLDSVELVDENLHTGLLFAELPLRIHQELFPAYDLSDNLHGFYYLWDRQERRFHIVSIAHTIAGIGQPVLIQTTPSLLKQMNAVTEEVNNGIGGDDDDIFAGSSIIADTIGSSSSTLKASKDDNHDKTEDLGILVGSELSGSRSWRLFFHLFPEESPKFVPHNSNASVASQNTNVFTPIRTAGYYRVDEKYVEINYLGQTTAGLTLTPPQHVPETTLSTRRTFEREMFLYATQPGDYIWVWQSSLEASERDETQTEDELLVKCTQRHVDATTQTLVLSFAAYPSHRQELMTQSVASRVVSHYTLSLAYDDIHRNEESDFSVRYSGLTNAHHLPVRRTRRWSSPVFLSHNPATFLIHHLRYKEQQVGHLLSSCFLYHAAVSLPAPLVYAAEILCVLLGSKPVTMVQLSSPSEHQWKFPLVTELSRAIIETASVYNLLHEEQQGSKEEHKASANGTFSIGHAVFTHGDDETLVLFRKSRQYLAENLLPRFTAQALHPMPYPNQHNHNPEALRQAYHDQLYNAAWNGFTLGYPAFFVRSYVENFHDNEISDVQERMHIYDSAARAFQNQIYRLSQGQISRRGFEIGYGLDEDLTRDIVPVTFLKGRRISSHASSSAGKQRSKLSNATKQSKQSDAAMVEWMKRLWKVLDQPHV